MYPRPDGRPSRHGPRGRSGFTLVELLVVIGIIALLISILLPTLSRARLAAKGMVCANNMRQISLAVVMYANDEEQWFPRTMTVETGYPETINWWRVDSYHKALERYIDGERGGVGEDGRDNFGRDSVWYDPADPDKDKPAMWGSFVDNGFLTGTPRKLPQVKGSSNVVMQTLRSRSWELVMNVPPEPLPTDNVDDPFWASEYFDVCLDPWAESNDPTDDYHWERGKAAPPLSLFPDEPGATEWDQPIDGRRPEHDGESRYGREQWYSFVDGSVRRLTFEETYLGVDNNMWSVVP
ncbi:MAG: prepilin-type N-terminal cleavage/methylation domain-containing protein [Planctomycetota bacterium]